MGIMAFIGFVLECGSIDGDTSGFLLRGLVDFGILDILSLVLLSQKFRDGRSKGCFSVIDMSDRSNVNVGLGAIKFGEGLTDLIVEEDFFR